MPSRLQLCALFVAALVLFGPGTLARRRLRSRTRPSSAPPATASKASPSRRTIPVIWGQNAGYLLLPAPRLQERRAQERPDVADRRDISIKDDLLPLAEYFSKLKWPNLQQPPAPDDVATKAQAAAASIGCPGCHLAYFQGDGTTARLAGQNHDYLHQDDDRFSRRHARQQSRHVRSDEGDLAGRYRRARAISRRPADRPYLNQGH